MLIYPKIFDIIVVGTGHAGCEAALVCARSNCDTLLLTIDLDTIAQMSCNPAIGGLAKGHLVRELDALGGEMAKVIDITGIQFRMLNTAKGPAVQAPRAQADKKEYQFEMKYRLEIQEGLSVKQGLVEEILVDKNKVKGLRTETNMIYHSKMIILTTGTHLQGLLHIGMENYSGGRSGEIAAMELSNSLRKLGFELARLKTGTPPRINGRTIDFSKLVEQQGDEPIPFFSYQTIPHKIEQLPCYITHTTAETHKIIKDNLDRSPLFAGRIKGTGPRYCPSIEDKVIRFPERNSHHIFLEPEGRNTLEYYANGISTSLPEDVQLAYVHTVPGLENAEIMRLGYAIEYDFIPPYQIKLNLETKLIENLFLAGQINGTSGYEEAAAQGFMAGVNAVYKLHNKKPFILERSEAYIGVLIDDLITKGTKEPYRLFTSRAEYRLLLRQDNADERLMEYGYKLGLLPDKLYQDFQKKEKAINIEIERLRKIIKSPKIINPYLEELGLSTSKLHSGSSLSQLLKRPEIKYEHLRKLDKVCAKCDKDVAYQVQLRIKYEGYIKRQIEQVERFHKLEHIYIPKDFDYSKMKGLKKEAKEKLEKIRPHSLGQASRISGISPADIAVLQVHIKRYRADKE